MEIVVRNFRLEDTKEITNLFRDTVRRVNSRDYSPEQIQVWAPEKIDLRRWRTRLLQSFAFVVTLDQKIIGFANLEPTGHVDFFYVHADYQGQKVGHHLMTSIEERAKLLNIGSLFAEVSLTARPFFEHHGFKVDEEETVIQQSVQFRRFRMSKILDAMDTLHEDIEQSLQYLGSDKAMASLESNPYWPKWDSPWWHMTLLNEMGLAKQIPTRTIENMVSVLQASPIKIFPIRLEEAPQGMEGWLTTHCHCALGNIYQTLAAAGVNVDEALPWIKTWFLKYQLPDGGLNCDDEAYRKDSPPSSMVGTISPLEAVLHYTDRDFTPEEAHFLDRGAQCVMERKLMFATTNPHNADELEDEADWLKLCFPRFYLYDVLRGLTFILHWADKRNKPIQRETLSSVVDHLEKQFPNGAVKNGRFSFDGKTTLLKSPTGEWQPRQAATQFPLLDRVSRIGEVSPFLSVKWDEAKTLLASISERDLLI